ncbi:MAG TPA: outer membrane beta-barrel protein [Chitinophagaceae bacterium]|nr:outer membrane beta-barrel protein [Chitinophagaceae bacterium]
MLKFSLLTAVLLSFFLASFSQQPVLSGTLRDAENKQPLIGATVKIIRAADSLRVVDSLVVASDKAGKFEFQNIPDTGTYYLIITSLGYELTKQEIIWKNVTKSLDDILINREAKTLSGVTVTAAPALARQKADTTEISASQLKVNPDANSEDLIKKAPGITVENGQVKVGGEQVRKVTVDGRDFFGDDASATLRNLPAEIVDKIQVFDRLSDQAQFTGVDDGSAAKSINIVTKPNMRNGQFGRFFAGYGTDNHYLAGGNMSYFKNNSRVSIVALTNDVNQQNFAEIDLLGATGGGGGGFGGGGNFRGQGGGRQGGGGFGGGGNFGGGGFGGGGFLVGQQPGVSKTNSIGINYNDKWGRKLDVSGSYFFNSRRTINSEDVAREYFNDSIRFYDQETMSDNTNYNHRANFRFDWKIDSFNSILITPSVNIQKYDNSNEQDIVWRNLEGDSTSKTFNSTSSERSAINFNNNILYRHSFRKRGRTFSMNLNTGVNNQNVDIFNDALSVFYKGSASIYDTTRQFKDQLTKGYQLSTSLNYTEPIGKKGAILEFRYNPSYTSNEADKKTYSFESASGKYSGFDSSLSNVFDNTYTTHRGGITYRKGERNQQISFGFDLQSATLESEQVFPYVSFIKRTFSNILPYAQINLPLSKKENIRIFYRANTNAPSVNQLQNVIDNTNPVALSTGNPALDQSYSHRIGGRYQYTNTTKGNSIFVNFFGSMTNNYVATATFRARRDSVLTPTVTWYANTPLTKPVNLDGQRNFNVFVTYAQPLKFIKTNVNLNAGFVINRIPGLVDNETGITRSVNYNAGVVLASNISQYVDYTVSYSGSFNNAKSTFESNTENKYFSQVASAKLNLQNKSGWVLNTDLTNQLYSGLSSGFNQSYWLWNMAVARKLFKGQKGEIRLSVFDLLNQNQSITRTVSETYLEDVNTKVVRQYFMLTFTYNLKNFGKAPVRNFNQNQRGDFFRRN